MYLFWSALSVLSGVLKNEAYIKEGTYTLYPNQYIVLTGPPGIGKGTAINTAWRLVKNNGHSIANILTDEITGPKLLEVIAGGWAATPKLINGQAIIATKEHTCTIIASELQSLLDSGEGMLVRFIKLWDQNEYEYRTKNQGSNLIKEMCVNVIGCTVPDYVRGMGGAYTSAVSGGFTARCIFVFEDKKSKELPDAIPLESDPKSKDLYDKLRNDLLHIAANVKGEYTKTDEARIIFSNFYPATTPFADDSDAMLNFKARMKVHIWKIAMLMSAARRDKMVIEGQDVRDAIYLVLSVKRQLDKVFRGAGSSDIAEVTAKVQSLMDRVGMVTKTELITALHRHMDPGTLDRVLYVLETIGYCTLRKINGKVYYIVVPKKVAGIGNNTKSANIP
jgi:energy-coupling factor transporter ATP-binding protein EcfA2